MGQSLQEKATAEKGGYKYATTNAMQTNLSMVS